MALTGAERKEALQTWGDWLSEQWRWDWFVTLTFDSRLVATGTRTIVGWSASDRAWHAWLDELAAPDGLWESSPPGGIPSDAYWVRGREPNPWRKGTHFHALIGGLPASASRRDAWRAWFGDGFRDELGKLQPTRHGLARILPFEPAKGAAHYLTKYVVKELGDVQFSDNLQLHRRVA